MEKLVIEIFGVVFKLLFRYWGHDKDKLRESIIDIEEFAQNCGLSIWDASKFKRSIDEFIDVVAEDFISEFKHQSCSGERKEAILRQIQIDIKKANICESKLISEMYTAENLQNLILEQSKEERKVWDDSDNALYNNCIKYIAKSGIDFVNTLPTFTPNALRIIIQRQDEYCKYLHKILSELHSMTTLIKSTREEFQEYESVYREKLVERYGKVELIGSGINNARNLVRYDISSAYVELSCINESEYGEEIKISNVFAENNIVWIKGEAGSGKTTFLQWVAVCAAKNDYKKIDNIRNTIPIVLELRNSKFPINLQDAVNKITESFGINSPNKWIQDLIKTNRLILLLDGLDEIDIEKREMTYKFIEDIAESNQKIKILLTARNSVKDSIQCKSAAYEILPMKTKNIKKFIVYWHKSVLRKDAIEKDEVIDRLQFNLKNKILKTSSLKVLARNPLLCAMICALNYVNAEQLPKDKIELYEKCCEMLIDARDTRRNIKSNKVDINNAEFNYNKKKRILEEIAYWMMNANVSSEDKVNVVGFLKNLLKNTTLLSGMEDKYTSEEVLDYLIERSGIIREPEAGVIDFVHKTFMEFLAVKVICRNCSWNILIREACNDNWKEAIIMCFQEMGQDDVKTTLNRLIKTGESQGDDRYILIASLGASNAFYLDGEMKIEINNRIKKLIPPKQRDIPEIAQAGAYLLPFLEDSNSYTGDEKIRCLFLLDRLGTEEIIPDVLTYITGNGDYDIKNYALSILNQFNDTILEEYNVKEQIIDLLISSIDNNSLVIYEGMLPLIGNQKLSLKDVKSFESVQNLCFIGSVLEDDCIYITEFIEYLNKCTKVAIIGYVENIEFLKELKQILELYIKADNNISAVLADLSSFHNLKTVKKLYIDVNELNYICENDLIHMKDLEIFELHCVDETLELDFNDFDKFINIKKVILILHEYLVYEVEELKKSWRGNNAHLEIIVTEKYESTSLLEENNFFSNFMND